MAMASTAGIEAVVKRVTMVVPGESSISVEDESGRMVVGDSMGFRETKKMKTLLGSNRRGHWRQIRMVVVLMLILMRLEEVW